MECLVRGDQLPRKTVTMAMDSSTENRMDESIVAYEREIMYSRTRGETAHRSFAANRLFPIFM